MKPGEDVSRSDLNGGQWKQMMNAGAKALESKKREVDALNVFPVPDGDTGTNMYLTIQAAIREMDKAAEITVAEVVQAISQGSLMGARGNSGVILSQLMRGMAKSLEGLTTVNGLQIAQALQTGVDTAYKAVMKPVEGTILTVFRETAKGAMNKAKQGGTPLEILREGLRKGKEILAKTPEMLPALKQAGVVDAGGQGFLIVLSGWIAALEGNVPAENFRQDKRTSQETVQEAVFSGQVMTLENLEYRYCTEFLIKGVDLRPEQIRKDLDGRGECLLVVGEPDLVKVHIHVKNPGKILDYAIQWGELFEIQVHNMMAQNEVMMHERKEEPTPVSFDRENGLVAVAMGQGVAEIFAGLGVDEVLSGGQTMNPSTEDLAAAVNKVPARNIYILPNNSNIVLAAKQVQELVKEKTIHVISSKSIPQGISALLNYNPEGTVQENLQGMTDGLSKVHTGEITYAVRNSQVGEIQIEAGDILGLVDDQIVANGKGLLSVAQATLDKMDWKNQQLVTVIYGEEVAQEEVRRLEEWLHSNDSQVEVEVYFGGQPLYYYIFGVE